MQIGNSLTAPQTALSSQTSHLVKQPAAVLQHQLVAVMPLHGNLELPRQMLKIHAQGGPKHLPVFLSVRHQRGAQTRMRKHPIQIQR